MSKKFLLLIFCLFIASCSPNKYVEGNYIFPNKKAMLKIGLSKTEVTNLLGPATYKASFNENILYYIYEVSDRKLKFLDKNITDSNVLIITFNTDNTISKIEIKTKDDRKNIPHLKMETEDSLSKNNLVDKRMREIDSFN